MISHRGNSWRRWVCRIGAGNADNARASTSLSKHMALFYYRYSYGADTVASAVRRLKINSGEIHRFPSPIRLPAFTSTRCKDSQLRHFRKCRATDERHAGCVADLMAAITRSPETRLKCERKNWRHSWGQVSHLLPLGRFAALPMKIPEGPKNSGLVRS